MNSSFTIKGTLKLKVARKDGSQIEMTIKNMVVNWGLTSLAGVLAGLSFPGTLGFLALGNSSVAPSLGDTALGNELRRDNCTVTQLTAPNDNQVQYQVIHAPGAVVGTFREAGLFTASVNGYMFNRTVFDDFVVGIADTLTSTWIIELRNA